MGIPDSSILDLLEKVRSWISFGASDLSQSCLSGDFDMPNNGVTMCSECNTNFTKFSSGYHCHSCGKWLCIRCVRSCESPKNLTVGSKGDFGEAIYCKFCSGIVTLKHGGGRKTSEKVHPSESPRESPEPPSPSFSGESIQSDQLAHYLESRDCGYSPHAVTNKFMTSFSAHPSPVSVRHSSSRSDDEEADDSVRHFYSPSSEYCNDISDIDSNSISARYELYSYRSVGSSPLDSPSRIDFTSNKVGHTVQRGQEGSPLAPRDGLFNQEAVAILRRPKKGTEDLENTDEYSDCLQTQSDKPQKPLDFESNGLIWFPPPPEDENDEAESNFFTYDDDDDEVGDSGTVFSASTSLSNSFSSKLKQNDDNKEPLRAVIQGHFRALVSQLLQGESIKFSNEDGSDDWLDIVTTMAWQAANVVKPDTSRGGSMDPVDYVKVKCIASGKPSDSTLVKGVVCTKNIKHKRMTTQYRNPKLLILGGALEYQNVVVDHDGQKKNVVNQLASFNTLVQQENDYLKMIISKIEALRPNVLLVEKSVSPYAQEYLLGKEISLVLNVKRPILERISRCTGASISPSIDSISTTRLGHCELFHVERVAEEHECSNPNNRKPTKTLMFFEGCPRRLGCTVLLRGTSREELKKVKHVIQYAVFAAYHLSLETSFLADEGASLPKMTLKHSIGVPEKTTPGNASSVIPSVNYDGIDGVSTQDDGSVGFMPEHVESESFSVHFDAKCRSDFSPHCVNQKFENELSDTYQDDLATQLENLKMATIASDVTYLPPSGLLDTMAQEETQLTESYELTKSMRIDDDEISSEYFSAADTHQSILVSFSSRCVLKGTVCERSRLLRIKFYGSFDKPLGRYLRDDLFDQTTYCRSCKEPAEAHVLCYTHQQGNLTINVRSLSSVKLPGERDGKIWMWHRCLRCAHKDGVPPATRRVVMSDAAWGLSFGKFLELSFSNHATANRVAPCGHSLQRDCLRFYGFGSMVAFFRYSPVDILNVHLPPSVLKFAGHIQQDWIRKEADELLGKMETFYAEIFHALDCMELRSKSTASESPDTSELQNHIMVLKDQLIKERNDYHDTLQFAAEESSQHDQTAVDILELNRLRRSLLIGSHVWDRQLYSLDSLLKTDYVVKVQRDGSYTRLNELFDSQCKHNQLGSGHQEIVNFKSEDFPENYLVSEQNESSLSCGHSIAEDLILSSRYRNTEEETHSDGELVVDKELVDEISSQTSNLSERIDSAWTGTDPLSTRVQPLPLTEGLRPENVRQKSISDGLPLRRLMAPVRVQSFDSALRFQERIRKVSTIRSFHASGDYRSMVRDPVSNAMRTYSQIIPVEGQKSNLAPGSAPSFISSASHMAGGARLLLPQRNHSDIVIGVYDNDPASIVSYALSSKDYEDWVTNKSNENDVRFNTREQIRVDSATSTSSTAWQSFGSVDLDYIHYGSYGGSEEMSSSIGSFFMDSKKSPHLTISYMDDSSVEAKVKFSVTCYFAKQFDSLRKKCCPSDVDFVRSLSRCQRWSAEGGKSNVYFAKSLDERFIIKQVKKTELESFEEFAPEYFKYLTDSLSSGSPTCLAKVLGIYQVSVKHLKGGRETKMDLMVMENLFFRRKVSRVYDLKGSARSRYNPDTSGANKVLLDMNLVEALRTEPIFLGSRAKRSLERAIWNDTSFLASVDVMDYSLLVGVDEDKKELVLGIIDFMRQYTWDKHLETWVKASGILGGPKNTSPTIISPKQYKKRFRKAMTSYFLTVPDQWSS